MSDVCPKCGFDSNRPDSVECPGCGIVFAKYRGNREKTMSDDLRKEDADEPEGIPLIDFKSKMVLVGILLVILYIIGTQWYGYLSERKIMSKGLRTIGKVTLVRKEGPKNNRRSYAHYVFQTEKKIQARGKTRKGGFVKGDLIEIAYLPDRPSENFPVKTAYGFKLTLFLSISLPLFFLGGLLLRFPDFRKYLVCRLKPGP